MLLFLLGFWKANPIVYHFIFTLFILILVDDTLFGVLTVRVQTA